MSKSLFFISIYENEKRITRKDFVCINQTEMKFNELNNIFSKQLLHSLSHDTLRICIDSLKGKKENDIRKEVDLLIEIFKKDLNSSEYKYSIVQSMFILSKKEVIYNTSIAISIFIDRIGAKKSKLYSKLEEIISNLKDSYLEKDILDAIESLNQYNIDIDI